MKNANRTSQNSEDNPESMTKERQSPLSVWWLAIRPKTLPAAVAPVIIGSVVAWQEQLFHLPSALAAAIGSLFIQIGTNLANDYFDFVKGSDRDDRVGPTRVMQAKLVSKKMMRVAILTAFLLATVAGSYLVYRGGWPIVAIGLASIIAGVLYTAGRYPLGYIGLGDLFVLIFFGPVAVCGTYYVQTLSLHWHLFMLSLSPGLLSVAILAVNNLRDIEEDRISGKKTLAVRFGAKFARLEYMIAIIVAALMPGVVAVIIGRSLWPLLTLLMLLLALQPMRQLFQLSAGEELNRTLAMTGSLLLLFSLLFTAGWLL